MIAACAAALRHGSSHHGSETFAADAVISQREELERFSALDEFRGVHGFGAVGALAARRGLRQRRIHPSAPDGDPREDKLRLMSESARGEGGRVWVPRIRRRSARREAFPRESDSIPRGWYPKYGNLVPRDIATRAIHRIRLSGKAWH